MEGFLDEEDEEKEGWVGCVCVRGLRCEGLRVGCGRSGGLMRISAGAGRRSGACRASKCSCDSSM